MKRQVFLSYINDKFPQDYNDYVEAIKSRNRVKTIELTQKMLRAVPKSESSLPYALKLSLEYIVMNYLTGNRELALSMIESVLKRANKSGDKDITADAEYVMGWILVREHRVEEAMQHLKKCIAIAEKLGIVLLLLNANIEVAQCASENRDLQYELAVLLRALKMARKTKSHIQEIHILLSIATLYNDIIDLKTSLEYMELAMERLNTLKVSKYYFDSYFGMLNNLEPQIMVRYALICYRHGKFEEALKPGVEILSSNASYETQNPRKVLYVVTALSFFKLNRAEEGLKFAALSLNEAVSYTQRPFTEVAYLSYGLMECLLAQDRTDLAEQLLESFDRLLKENNTAQFQRIYWRMTAVYSKYRGDEAKRVKALEEYMVYAEIFNKEKDEEFNRGIRNQIKLMEELQRTERQKERQKAMLNTAEAKIEAADYQSDHDGLTGLYNRNKLNKDRVSEQFKEMKSCGIIFFDVNDLKLTNDVFGHEVGDKVLVDMAQSLKRFGDERYHAYRMGGDEFMLIIRDCAEDELDVTLENWHRDMESHNSSADIRCVVAAGCAYGCGDFNVEDLINRADERMYDNKRSIKNHESRVYALAK
jgi:diguanylate cyclase (GGDEF)-like protein